MNLDLQSITRVHHVVLKYMCSDVSAIGQLV